METTQRPLGRRTAATPDLAGAWAAAAAAARRWRPIGRRLVVVVPHPDDEVLATAGLLLAQRRHAAPLRIVAVTDGDAAYPDVHPRLLARRRVTEQRAALHALGVPDGCVVRLGMGDGALPTHVGELSAALDALVEDGDVVVAPWRADHHADHVACAHAAAPLARRPGVSVLGSLFWAYHHSPPPPARRLLRLDLPAADVERRWAALAAHHSQLPAARPDSILTPALLAPLHAAHELFVRVDR